MPARGEATFLFGCPMHRGFIVGGTDARASAADVRVWFDGQLGAPIGASPSNAEDGAVLLFHALTYNLRAAFFQPILGCVSLTQASKRSTVSILLSGALPGRPPVASLDLRANTHRHSARAVKLPTLTVCPTGETLVGSWSGVAFATSAPPAQAYARDVTIRTFDRGGKVHAVFAIANALFVPLAPIAEVQVGAMCKP